MVFIYYIVIFISILILIEMIRLLIRSREQAVKSTQDVYVEDINNMFASIRGQQHDFINHLQVVHSLAQMEKTAELKRYVVDLVHETREMSDIVNHSHPALAAFVQAKTTVAVTKGIAFSCELLSLPAESSSIRTIDMIKILGNLVDNAFDEVMSLSAGKRFVRALVKHEFGRLLLEVSNQGRILNEEEKEKILTPGYSTKKTGGHDGLGLAIVAERTKHYGGTLEVESHERLGGTTFRISIPLNNIN